MLKSYKRVARWYPALEPSTGAAASAPVDGETVFGDEDGHARFPHYIREDEPEMDIPPVPESVLRRSHFDGSWSDWVTDRESASYAPKLRYRESTVVEFPAEGEQGSERPARTRSEDADPAAARPDAVPAPPTPDLFRRRRVFALVFLIVAILLLAAAGGVALYVLNSHSGTSQSIGTLWEDAGSGPSVRLAAYNEMTATAVIGDHIPATGIRAG
ncbi:hypothetical protein [Nocardia jejuensis]|uniref:hypothetical protein n=1 Tax=Nocardia jejuensis TaxID=328049 RepID=UPI0012FA01A3|nr:hypothetical protein [Nocardia jejuensis]